MRSRTNTISTTWFWTFYYCCCMRDSCIMDLVTRLFCRSCTAHKNLPARSLRKTEQQHQQLGAAVHIHQNYRHHGEPIRKAATAATCYSARKKTCNPPLSGLIPSPFLLMQPTAPSDHLLVIHDVRTQLPPGGGYVGHSWRLSDPIRSQIIRSTSYLSCRSWLSARMYQNKVCCVRARQKRPESSNNRGPTNWPPVTSHATRLSPQPPSLPARNCRCSLLRVFTHRECPQ